MLFVVIDLLMLLLLLLLRRAAIADSYEDSGFEASIIYVRVSKNQRNFMSCPSHVIKWQRIGVEGRNLFMVVPKFGISFPQVVLTRISCNHLTFLAMSWRKKHFDTCPSSFPSHARRGLTEVLTASVHEAISVLSQSCAFPCSLLHIPFKD